MTDQPAPPENSSDDVGNIVTPEIGLLALFGLFLHFGLLAFGGPVAQIAMLRQALVADRRWISSARFNKLLAILQILPGPEAHELCVHLGMIARGRIGGILAGLGFMLPGFLLMLLVSWLYVGWAAGQSGWASVLIGIQIVVLAIILRAVVRIGQHIIEDRWLGLIALGAFGATLIGLPFWASLLAGGAAYALIHRPVIALATLAAIGVFASFIAFNNAPIGPPAPPRFAVADVTALALFLAGLKGGLLTFGGAYTAIPYVRADTVGRGWITDSTFLDGVAFASMLPAPLVIFSTFVGYNAGGLAGALAMTAGMFLPAFLFSLVLFERLEAIVHNPGLHRVLSGVSAAVVGIIAETLIDLARSTTSQTISIGTALGLFAIALVVVWKIKGAWVTPVLVGIGAIAGKLLF